MKTLLIFLIFLCGWQYCSGQDTIILKNKKQLDVKITEKDLNVVRYRMPDYEDGPVVVIRNNRIRKIIYKNGTADLMGYQNPRKSRPLGLSLGYAGELTSGGTLFLATADYFVIPQIDLEANLGTSDLSGGLYYTGGLRLHFNTKTSERRLTPFTGVLGGEYYGDPVIQIPVGVNYITPIGINASISINEMISPNSWNATFLELRIGWRFRL